MSHNFAGPRPAVRLGIPGFVMEARELLRCRADPDAYFADGIRPEKALALCGGCAQLEPCRQFAVTRPELLGVWGGTTAGERRTLRRRSSDGLAAAS